MISWIRGLIHRAHKICSNDELLNLELNNIVSFMSWNGFPRKLSRKFLTLFKPSFPNPNNSNNVVIDPTTTTKVWIHLPFLGKYGTKLTNNFIRKISPLLKSPCKFIVNWKTTDTNCFISLKDPTPKTYQSSVVYEFKCPGCNANYVGKTYRCLCTRNKEHSSLDSSEIYNHITSCNEFNFVINLLELTPNDEVNNIKCSVTDLVFTNTKIQVLLRNNLTLHSRSERVPNAFAFGTRLERGRNAVGTRLERGRNAVGTRMERVPEETWKRVPHFS